jgi:hypothetical protein
VREYMTQPQHYLDLKIRRAPSPSSPPTTASTVAAMRSSREMGIPNA